MYKVLIAEDEVLVRMGMSVSVPWAQLGMQVVAEVANGEAALQAYHRFRPHLVITDIKMPGLDGLSLLREIRKVDSDCAFVVITCVEQFDSLHEAMSMDIVAYMVKATMTQGDILAAVNKAKQVLDVRFQGVLQDGAKGPDPVEILHGYLTEGAVDGEALRSLFAGGFSSLLAVQLVSDAELQPLLGRTIMNILHERLAFSDQTWGILMDQAIYFTGKEKLEYTQVLLQRVQSVREYVRDTFSVSLRFALCEQSIQADQLKPLTQRIARFYPQLFDTEVLLVTNIGAIQSEPILRWLSFLRENAWRFREGASVSRYVQQVEKLAQGVQKSWTACRDELYGMARFLWARTMPDLEKTVMDIPDTSEDEAAGVHMLFEAYGKEVFEPAIALGSPTVRLEVAESIRYMMDNLPSELTLRQVAAHIGLHPNYFSLLFKQEMHISFSDFLSELRIGHAQALLRDPRMTIQEVSDRAGFSDISYFSRRFKQVVGITPTQWRTRA